MAEAIVMPRQGQSVETCIITKWFKKKGDPVKSGDILFSYETDKASFEEEAKSDGILLEIFRNEDDEVPVLSNVGVIGKEGESADPFRPEGSAASSGSASSSAASESGKSAAITDHPAVQNAAPGTGPSAPASGAPVSPRAKNLARQLGVAAESAGGTGPYGRVIARDVAAFAQKGPRVSAAAREAHAAGNLHYPAAGSGPGGMILCGDLTSASQSPAQKTSDIAIAGGTGVKKISNMRKIISQKMMESLQNSAQLTMHTSADARAMMSLRKTLKKQIAENPSTPNITINDMVCFAAVAALKKHPAANAHFYGDSQQLFDKVHLGIAVDTERGLMVPTVMNADDLSLGGLCAQAKDLFAKCKSGNISPELLQGGTFTVSNLGSFGVEVFTPIINPPQVAILGVTTIVLRPKDIGGITAFVPHIGLSLTIDHRVLDGAPAAAFLQEVVRQIETIRM